MKNFNHSRILSFRHAFDGILYLIKTQKNTWIYGVITILVIIASFVLKVTLTEGVFLILMIGLVWSGECFNTAIECTVDLITAEIHPLAKLAKDTAAAAVLILAITSAIIGGLIFGNHLLPIIFPGI